MANNFPTIIPSLNLQFSNTGVLPPDVTFTRASQSGGYYDGRTVSKAEENLLIRSQEFDNASWSKTRTTVTANTTVAPDGTTTADSLIETTDSGTHFVQQSTAGIVSGFTYTGSVVVKKGVGATAPDIIQITLTDGFGVAQYANFDISIGGGTSGTVTASTGGVASISNAGNDFWRCVFTATATSSATGGIAVAFCNNNPAATRLPSYVGATTSDVILWGAQLEQRSTVTAYTPTTTAPITNYIPKMLFAPANVPVFDHNPVTGESLGLSVWEARTNLILRSQEFDNAAWTKANATIGVNQTIAPDGTLTADRLIENASGSVPHSVGQSFSASAIAYTFSVYVKPNGRTTIQVYIRDMADSGTEHASRTFDITNPSDTATTTMRNVGNGWWRLSVSGTPTAGTRWCVVRPVVAGTAVYVGDGVSGFEVWGAQLEAGAFATPYIPTVASTVTRSADAAVMTGVNFSSWFNAGAGTLVAEYTNAGGSATVVSANDGTNNNRITLLSRPSTASSNDEFAVLVTGAVSQAAANNISYATQGKSAISYKFNDIAATMNGAAVRTDTAAVIPVVDRLSFGAASTTVGSVYIRSLAFYPIDLSDANIVAVTA